MKRGDVIIAELLYSDRAGSKIRPAVVVSTDRNNAVIDDVILVAVSRSTRRTAFTHVFIDPATPDGQQSGLLHPSYVQCENLFTLDRKFIINTIGTLSATLQEQVDFRLEAALELG